MANKKLKDNPQYKEEDYTKGKTNTAKEKPKKQSSGTSVILVSVILAAIAIFIFICYVAPQVAGAFGEWFKGISFGTIGGAAFLIPVFLLLHALMHKRNVQNRSHYYKWVYTVFIILVSSMFIHTVVHGINNRFTWNELFESGKSLSSGGCIGGGAAQLLNRLIGPAGVIIFAVIALIILVVLFLDITPSKIVDRVKFYMIRSQEKRVEREKIKESARNEQIRKNAAKKAEVELNQNRNNSKADIDEDLFAEEKNTSKQPKRQASEVYVPDYSQDNKSKKIETLEVVPVEDTSENTYTDLSKIFDQPENNEIKKSYSNRPKADTSETEIKEADTELRVTRKKSASAISTNKIEDTEDIQDNKDDYKYPPVELLESKFNAESTNSAEEEVRYVSEKLESTLAVFNVNVKVIGYSRGPAITRYEVALEEGTRVSKISTLADELSYSLATQGIIIEGVVEGKSAIGIEVPNKKKAFVYLRDLIDDDKFRNAPSLVWSSIGMDVAGEKRYLDIAKMPHLLVAGATGMGKSVCINSFIVSILYKSKPEEVKLILIDPKKVEFSMYKEMPHLLVPVISDPKKAAGALHWATQEMDRRFEILEATKVRNLDEYHEAVIGRPEMEYLPRIVIIIDELADLMQTAGKEVESYICRIAQKARAAGMHLVIGTQRPSVDVVTGLIKANVPSRIACKVASNVDSRTILDRPGAEKLLGQGDMLFMPVGAMKPIRIQGSFVSNEEVAKVVEFIKTQRSVQTDDQIMAQINKNAEMSDNGSKGSSGGANVQTGSSNKEEDIMLDKAIEVAFEADKISTSLLQRKLSLGFGRAAKLIDIMEERGIVGPPDGQKPRQILISKEEYYQMKMNRDTSTGESEEDE